MVEAVSLTGLDVDLVESVALVATVPQDNREKSPAKRDSQGPLLFWIEDSIEFDVLLLVAVGVDAGDVFLVLLRQLPRRRCGGMRYSYQCAPRPCVPYRSVAVVTELRESFLIMEVWIGVGWLLGSYCKTPPFHKNCDRRPLVSPPICFLETTSGRAILPVVHSTN